MQNLTITSVYQLWSCLDLADLKLILKCLERYLALNLHLDSLQMYYCAPHYNAVNGVMLIIFIIELIGLLGY